MPGIEILFLGCHKVQCTMNSQQAAAPVILVTAPTNNKETLQQFCTVTLPTPHNIFPDTPHFLNIETSQCHWSKLFTQYQDTPTQYHPRNIRTHPRNIRTHPRNIRTHPRNIRTHPRNIRTHPRNIRTHPRNILLPPPHSLTDTTADTTDPPPINPSRRVTNVRLWKTLPWRHKLPHMNVVCINGRFGLSMRRPVIWPTDSSHKIAIGVVCVSLVGRSVYTILLAAYNRSNCDLTQTDRLCGWVSEWPARVSLSYRL